MAIVLREYKLVPRKRTSENVQDDEDKDERVHDGVNIPEQAPNECPPAKIGLTRWQRHTQKNCTC